ncbi:uncharacterized protein LOC141912033 isoform X2 [Tubulanus polymorphus]|uniref:uncharacterized protein LOC141912033 isoform X2 n=1 Tax=Tubulanus polymorphus TaxID=672921 RepID=UPI003DA61B4F
MREQVTDENMAIDSVPAPENLARQGKGARQGQRPDHPNDLHFQLETDFIADGFFRKDISVDDRRHLVFATQKQVDILKGSKRWYMDVRRPFTKLFSIHSFVRSGKNIKQIPLVFVLIYGKRKKDYKKVLKAVMKMFGDDQPKVKQVSFVHFWFAFSARASSQL